LLRSGDPVRCRGELVKSAWYGEVASSDKPDGLNGAVKERFAAVRSDLLSGCPDHLLKDWVYFSGRYRDFRSGFIKYLAETVEEGGVEVETRLRLLLPAGEKLDRLPEHRAMLYRVDSPENSGMPERSFYLDSLACSLLDLYGQDVPETDLRTYWRDQAALMAWTSLVRARRNRVPVDRLLKYFVFGRDRSLTAAVLSEDVSPVKSIRPFISRETWEALDALPLGRMGDNAAGMVADALFGRWLACRRVVSGPERVVAYLEALAVEEINLNICLTAVAGGLDPAVAEKRLRRELDGVGRVAS